MENSSHRWLRPAGAIGAALLWWLWSITLRGPGSRFPALGSVIDETILVLSGAEFYRDLLFTLGRAFTGFVLGGLLGTAAGLLLARSEFLNCLVDIPLEVLRAIPSPVLFLLAIGLTSQPEFARMAVVFYTCFFIQVIYAREGGREVSMVRREVAFTLGHSSWRRFWTLDLFEALPHVFAALRITSTVALILAVITEMIGGSSIGVGVRIQEEGAFQVARRYSYVLVLGIVGWWINWMLARLESRVVHWHGH